MTLDTDAGSSARAPLPHDDHRSMGVSLNCSGTVRGRESTRVRPPGGLNSGTRPDCAALLDRLIESCKTLEVQTGKVSFDFGDRPKLVELLRVYAAQTGRSQKDVVAEALEAYFANHAESDLI